MARATNNAALASPKEVLEEALDCVGKEGPLKNGTKIVIMCLDDTSGDYDVGFLQAGMRMSECLALADVAKVVFMEEMGFFGGE